MNNNKKGMVDIEINSCDNKDNVENNEEWKRMAGVDKSLRKGTEGFLSVLDKLEGVLRKNDFKRLED